MNNSFIIFNFKHSIIFIDFYALFKLEDNYGIIQHIQNNFKEMKSTDITGNDCNKSSGKKFNPKRLIVIEMKETEEQKRIREENEKQMIEKTYKEHIINNIAILEEYSGYKYKEIIYDSNKDGKSSSIFRNKIINRSHLYFIIIDSNDNVFGHYHNNVINKFERKNIHVHL